MPDALQNLTRRWFTGLSGAALIALMAFGPTNVTAAQEGSADVRQGKQEFSDKPKPYTQQPAGKAVAEVRRIPKPAPPRKPDSLRVRPKAGGAVSEPDVDERADAQPRK